uniref:Speckle-type POZ protein-like (inferred by orthology to a human protein) n=1 Tax=Strongyloides venezuelensis TaxID=75913 RepID=A0A0K0F5N3_STRVS
MGNHESANVYRLKKDIAKWDLRNIQADVTKFNIVFSIQNFSKRLEVVGQQIRSATCVIQNLDRLEWCLDIYPNGFDQDSKEYVSVFLILLKPERVKVKLKFSILNDKEEKENVIIAKNVIKLGKNEGGGPRKFIKKDLLLNESNGLLINDKLRVLCKVETIETGNTEA